MHDGISSRGWLMTYSTLMAHFDLGVSNEGLLRVAADLAERFKARVIGIAACQPMQITYGDGYMSGDVIEQDRAEIEKETNKAEARFNAVLHGKIANLEWRSTISYLSLADYVAQQARATDLLITGPDQKGSPLDSSRRVNIGDLVMRAGRPVLIVPPSVDRLKLESVVVGWKDTRETRRAVADALPFLKHAGRVTIVEVAAEDELPAARDRLKDVVGWLKQHDIVAGSVASASTGDDGAQLDAIARDNDAGLLVAGAYGHNRLREWVLGGVTRNLLLNPGRCSLVSH